MSTLPLAHAGDPPHTVAPDDAEPPPRVGRRAIVSWFLFDWAAQPVNTLITTFVIPPFFVGVVVPRFLEGIAAGDPASAAATMTADDMEALGQAWWGWAMGYFGGMVALVILLAFFVADADETTTFFGFAPLFGSTRRPMRACAPPAR